MCASHRINNPLATGLLEKIITIVITIISTL
jgi:hypothetical protein